jgi:ankyrin repeat protein
MLDPSSLTPLSYAAQNGHETAVRLLLSIGAIGADLKDRDGRTPLFWAARNGHAAVVQLMLDTDTADVDSKNE